ncbi:MAG TPA: hypothetical protein ENK67_04315 [Flavobacteriia bacterium]|nr:hypothetical protein [Flavobacteriia bacterium]
MKYFIQILVFIIGIQFGFSQKNTELKNTNNKDYQDLSDNPNGPAKAAFYSAVLPGLGQAYNKKYWKIPLVYGALGTSIYFYKRNDDNYNRYLTALKLKLDGKENEFGETDITGLERGVKFYKKQRDLMLFVTIGVYVLNILEANVDAHLPDKKIDANLSFKPNFFLQPVSNTLSYGFTLNIKL